MAKVRIAALQPIKRQTPDFKFLSSPFAQHGGKPVPDSLI
jgi:hypothetical protein